MRATEVPTDAAAWGQQDKVKGRLVMGGLWSSANFLLSLMLGLPLTVLLVRSMSRSAYGDLAIAVSTMTLLAIPASLGLAESVTRELTGVDEAGRGGEDGWHSRVLASAWRISARAVFIGSLVIALVIAAFEAAGATRGAVWPLAVLAPVVLLAPVQSLLVGLTRVVYRPGAAFAAGAAASATTLLGSVILVVTGVVSATPMAAVRTA